MNEAKVHHEVIVLDHRRELRKFVRLRKLFFWNRFRCILQNLSNKTIWICGSWFLCHEAPDFDDVVWWLCDMLTHVTCWIVTFCQVKDVSVLIWNGCVMFLDREVTHWVASNAAVYTACSAFTRGWLGGVRWGGVRHIVKMESSILGREARHLGGKVWYVLSEKCHMLDVEKFNLENFNNLGGGEYEGTEWNTTDSFCFIFCLSIKAWLNTITPSRKHFVIYNFLPVLKNICLNILFYLKFRSKILKDSETLLRDEREFEICETSSELSNTFGFSNHPYTLYTYLIIQPIISGTPPP